MEDTQWLYYDASRAQKGPIPSTVMFRLLEKGIGVTPETLVWKSGMPEWRRMAEVEEFKEMCIFIAKQWYYLDANNTQKGPVLSRLIVHKLQAGELDGMSMMFSSDMKNWTPLSEIPELKKVAQNIADEESRAASLLTSVGAEDQTFSADMYADDMPPVQQPSLNDTNNNKDENENDDDKEFINDDGIRHVWDRELNEWVVAEEGDDTGDEGVASADRNDRVGNTKETSQFFKELDANKAKTKCDGDASTMENDSNELKPEKRKRNKKKKKTSDWNASSNLWVYVSNLPFDVTLEEIKAHFSKVGLIALNPVDQMPKIKLYLDETGQPKGDCTICYNAESSANMALEVLDGGYIRPSSKPLSVTRAEFQKREHAPGGEGSQPPRKKQTLTQAQIKVSQNAMAQALAWNEDDDVGVSKSKALKIVVLENMFDPKEVDKEYKGQDTQFFEDLEKDIAMEAEKCGQIDKITIFSRSPQGAIIIKYCTSYAAQECVRMFDGRLYAGKKLRCKFWDGVMDYTAVSVPPYADAGEDGVGVVSTGALEESRLDAFGDWLDNEQDELPEEFRLRVE